MRGKRAMQTDPSASSSGPRQVGAVAALWRYPVKSMMGEELNSCEVTGRGLLGDRQFAVVDRATGKGSPGATAEEYWPDMAGLDYRDTVTDFDMPAGTFFDTAVVHLLTTATIDRLRGLYPPGRFEARRFRSNIVVALRRSSTRRAQTTCPAGFFKEEVCGSDQHRCRNAVHRMHTDSSQRLSVVPRLRIVLRRDLRRAKRAGVE